MKIYPNRKSDKVTKKSGLRFTRRRFLKSTTMLFALYLVPMSACKRMLYRDEEVSEAYRLSIMEKEILALVQEHLFPAGDAAPGAGIINATAYYEFVLSDKHLENYNRKLLINGIRWVEETAEELYNSGFANLSAEQKESVLRDLESYKNGKRWLSKVLNYILEALLGSPAYGINTNEAGWKWLGHTPGMPQPLADRIYGTYGYGL
jgi:hypothetical protein